LRHEAVFSVRFCSQEEAKMAERSLAPDNKPLPPYLSLEVDRVGEELIYKVACSGRPAQTLLSTLDDIIQALLLVEPIICEIREKGRK